MASEHSSSTHSEQAALPGIRDSPLHFAAMKGDAKRVKQRLSKGDNVEALCRECVDDAVCVVTPLYCAVGQRHEKVVKVLLAAGANPCTVNSSDGTSVLYLAATYGNLEVVTMLIKAGAVVDGTDNKKRTALYGAASAGYSKVVEALLSANATVDMACQEGLTPLMAGAQHGNVDIIRALLDAGAVIDETDDDGRTALQYAAFIGNADAVEVLLSAGATFDTADRDGSSVLYAAALNGKDDVLKLLLRCGASVDTPNLKGRTALFAAANAVHSTTVKLLLDAGADPHIRDHEDATALMHAVDLPTVKLLLEAGVSATDVDDEANSALHYSGGRGCSSGMICAVFKAGCNPTLLNGEGQTAAQVAREEGHDDAATLLDMLAAKYTQTENSVLEANEKPSSVVPSEGVAELDVKMKAACVSDTSNEVVVESNQAIEEEQKHKVRRPCLNCQTLTHRRCARCRTAYICSHDCQVATLAAHRVECMEIYEEKEGAKAERKAAGWKDESC